MVLTALGKRYRHIQGYVHTLRKDLEAHAVKEHGELTPVITAEINLACRYEVTAAIALHHVSRGPDLPASEVLSLLKTATWATAERNRCIGRLGIKANATADPWATFDATRQRAAASGNAAQSTPQGTPEATSKADGELSGQDQDHATVATPGVQG